MQQVKCVPLLCVHNRFACLEVENENPLPPPLHAESPVKVTLKSKTTLTPHLLHLRQWERRLPKQYVVAATPGPKSLPIKVEIQTTDTTEVKSGPALVDCGVQVHLASDLVLQHWNLALVVVLCHVILGLCESRLCFH